MTFDSFENIVSLLCTIAGLIYCVFQYIEAPRRGYRYLMIFFLANFLSEYYWTIYELIMHETPDVSAFVAYLGWNIGYLSLALAVYVMQHQEARRFFHPLMLLPLVLNVPQFLLYIQYGGILNNLWEVGLTTLTATLCLQELLYVRKLGKKQTGSSLFFLLVLLFIALSYGMWTSSCFEWPSEPANPYLYCSVLASVVSVFLVYGADRHYRASEPEASSKSASELRFQVLVQAVTSILIIGICAAGFFIAFLFKSFLPNENGPLSYEGRIVIFLFVNSAVLILLILALLYVLTSRYPRFMEIGRKMSAHKRSLINFYSTIFVTLILMAFAVIYNNTALYNASVVSVYEDGAEEIKTTATELENYLTVAVTTLRVTADNVDLMVKNGSSVREIERYLTDQTTRQAEQFDENFTGIYACIDGVYLDGLGWTPPEGYTVTERDWYKTAAEADGRVSIVSPYVDAQTGSVVITVCKMLSPEENGKPGNVVCLDVIVNHIKEIARELSVSGKGYGMVVNADGFVIAHPLEECNGHLLSELYDPSPLDSILSTQSGRCSAEIDGEACTLFVAPVMDQWYTVLVIGNAELFEDTYSQLAINIMVSLIIFCLITFFYYLSYKNEQIYGHKVEELNIQVVSALAAAIDAKDTYTNGHSARVAEYARMIAARTGFSKSAQDEIYMMGLLHDVGKIGVPDEVINKPSKLSEEEFDIVKKHPVIGSSILASIRERPMLATGARWHHEHYGGGGYPDGIAGDDIPEEARIIAVADAYDAMTSRRSYRDIMPQKKVLSEIRDGMGTQFDPRFAKAMIEMIEEDKDYTMREGGQPSPEKL